MAPKKKRGVSAHPSASRGSSPAVVGVADTVAMTDGACTVGDVANTPTVARVGTGAAGAAQLPQLAGDHARIGVGQGDA